MGNGDASLVEEETYRTSLFCEGETSFELFYRGIAFNKESIIDFFDSVLVLGLHLDFYILDLKSHLSGNGDKNSADTSGERHGKELKGFGTFVFAVCSFGEIADYFMSTVVTELTCEAVLEFVGYVHVGNR